MKKILHKIKYHILESKKKKTLIKTKFSFLSVSLFMFIFSVTSLVSIFFITRGTNPETSELAFMENSILGSSAGSVIPASCESYPAYGIADFLGDSYGFCAGTAPVDAVCGTTHYSCAAGRDTASGGVNTSEDASGYRWHCGASNGGIDAVNCFEAKAAPPTVNIQFQ